MTQWKWHENLSEKQQEAVDLIGGDSSHTMLFGGSRSGKSFVLCFLIVCRALMAPGSRHGIFRFAFNAVKHSIGMDTLPKVITSCFPGLTYKLDRTDWVFRFDNGSEIWLGGLDEKDRTEKVLGMEFATLFVNECSQIRSWSTVAMIRTRLAQSANKSNGQALRLKMFYDCNPPGKGHWTYKVFVTKRDPDTAEPISRPEQYQSLLMNPTDNLAHLPTDYLDELSSLPARQRLRFLEGRFAEEVPGALWTLESIETWRKLDTPPDMVRIVVAVDPSGSGDANNADNDAIGIVVAGVGMDGIGYLLADYTVKAGPATWGSVVASAYDRHAADCVVAEQNYGGDMVRNVILSARPRTPYRSVTASRGKHVRAEPVSSLAEQGKIRHVGHYPQLEDELCSFSTAGYMGSGSPNRADAYVWAFSELFPGLTRPAKVETRPVVRHERRLRGGWTSL